MKSKYFHSKQRKKRTRRLHDVASRHKTGFETIVRFKYANRLRASRGLRIISRRAPGARVYISGNCVIAKWWNKSIEDIFKDYE